VSRTILLAISLLALSAGCGAVIEPGHRGLLFDPQMGLQHEVLSPGYHRVGLSGRIDDFDVTYSTRAEALQVITREGLSMRGARRSNVHPVLASSALPPDYRRGDVVGSPERPRSGQELLDDA
jgi:hypothetical protein